MPKSDVVERSHHVRMIVGVPQSTVLGIIEDIEGRKAPAMRRTAALMDGLLRHFGECVTAAPGLSVFGVVVAEFCIPDEIDIDFEVYRRRSEIRSANSRFLESAASWANDQFGRETKVPTTFVRGIAAATRSYSVVNSHYSLSPPKPSPSLPSDIATRMKRMRSETLMVVLRWLARKLYDREKITGSLLERIESEAAPRPKGRKPNMLEW